MDYPPLIDNPSLVWKRSIYKTVLFVVVNEIQILRKKATIAHFVERTHYVNRNTQSYTFFYFKTPPIVSYNLQKKKKRLFLPSFKSFFSTAENCLRIVILTSSQNKVSFF